MEMGPGPELRSILVSYSAGTVVDPRAPAPPRRGCCAATEIRVRHDALLTAVAAGFQRYGHRFARSVAGGGGTVGCAGEFGRVGARREILPEGAGYVARGRLCRRRVGQDHVLQRGGGGAVGPASGCG